MTNPVDGEGSDLGPELDPRYVASRRVLLDALTALAPHGTAFIVAGAQAVYLRTGSSDIAIAPHTTDGDLALDPLLMGDEPELERSMREAGFELYEPDGVRIQPGTWIKTIDVNGEQLTVSIDLIVPDTAAGGGRHRGARLGVHGNRAARRAAGLEAALVDHSRMTIRSLDSSDLRFIDVEVAGVAALLIAKSHKIHDRLSGDDRRLKDKDAADIYRIMQTASVPAAASTFRRLRDDAMAGESTAAALTLIEELFGRRAAPGVVMAQRALRLAVPEAQVATLCVSFTEHLLALTRSDATDG